MFKKISFTVLAASLGALIFSQLIYAETKTTTVEESSTQTTITPRATKKVPVPVTTSTSTSNVSATSTTEIKPRQVLSEDTLKKISNTLCTDGFKAYVGTNKKNICQSKVTAPDIAYSCVWDKKGTAAYTPSVQGPCALDYAEHRGSMIITKTNIPSNPPLPYGAEAQCCYRAATGSMTSN